MLRRVLAVIIGIIAAMIIIQGFEFINSRLYPFPPGMDTADQNQLAAFVKTLPNSAFALVLTGWAIGSFVCGWLIGIISRSTSKIPAYLAGLLLMTGGIVTIFMFDHPLWFTITGLVLFIPLTLLGHAVYRLRRKS